MAKAHLGQIRRSQHLGYGFKPRSRLDLFNPGKDKEANEEVVAFLKWLDRQEDKAKASNELGSYRASRGLEKYKEV